eukprot:COSAG01_NODE_136_length_24438_cov_243.426711_3_plen_301_part_00
MQRNASSRGARSDHSGGGDDDDDDVLTSSSSRGAQQRQQQQQYSGYSERGAAARPTTAAAPPRQGGLFCMCTAAPPDSGDVDWEEDETYYLAQPPTPLRTREEGGGGGDSSPRLVGSPHRRGTPAHKSVHHPMVPTRTYRQSVAAGGNGAEHAEAFPRRGLFSMCLAPPPVEDDDDDDDCGCGEDASSPVPFTSPRDLHASRGGEAVGGRSSGLSLRGGRARVRRPPPHRSRWAAANDVVRLDLANDGAEYTESSAAARRLAQAQRGRNMVRSATTRAHGTLLSALSRSAALFLDFGFDD